MLKAFRLLVQSATMSTIRNATTAVNARVARSAFGRVFRLQGSGHVSLVIVVCDAVNYVLKVCRRKSEKGLSS
jgi:hypothetical protein